MELILIRHGLPERRDDTSDPPLCEVGRDQAVRAARYLARDPIDAVFSSTMLRAIQTAGPFAAQSGHAVLTREGIGYGGVDITPDVEKSLNITEKPTPSPGT